MISFIIFTKEFNSINYQYLIITKVMQDMIHYF